MICVVPAACMLVCLTVQAAGTVSTLMRPPVSSIVFIASAVLLTAAAAGLFRLLFRRGTRPPECPRLVSACAASTVFAALIAMICVLRCFQTILIPAGQAVRFDGGTVDLDGQILTFYDTGPSGWDGADILAPESRDARDEGTKTGRIARTPYGLVYLYGRTEGLQYGDRFRGKVEVSQPSPARNPGGFDERSYYAGQGIFLKGRLLSFEQIGTASLFSPAAMAWRMRSALIRSFRRMMPADDAGMMAALTLGDTGGLSPETKAGMADAGVSHITAVSGSAVAMVFFPLSRLLRRLRIRKKLRDLLSIAFLAAFGYLTLWTPSVSRAIAMVMIVKTAGIFRQKISFMQTLALTAIVIAAIKPAYVLSAGFWFSLTATAGIICFSGPLAARFAGKGKTPGAIATAAGLSAAAGLSVLPLQILLDGRIAAASLLSNLLILPAFQLAVPAGLFLAAAGPAVPDGDLLQWLALPLRGMVGWILGIAGAASRLDFLSVRTGRSPALVAAAVAAVLACMLLRSAKGKRIALILSGCFLFSALAAGIPPFFRRDELTVVFADVGQGDATLIMTGDGTSVLIDTGDDRSGSAALEGIMDYYGIMRPQMYIITHTHSDHCGALAGLLAERGGNVLVVPPGAFGSVREAEDKDGDAPAASGEDESMEDDVSAQLYCAALEHHVQIVEASRDDRIPIGSDAGILVCNPSSDRPRETEDLNRGCLVILFYYKDFRILISGDATDAAEEEMIGAGLDLKADIYRIAHHGSPSSTNHDIINAVDPGVSIISVGANFYGHPSKEVIGRLLESGSRVFRTDRDGAVIVRYNKGVCSVKSMIP